MKIVSLDPLGCKQGVFAPARCIMNKMVRREAPEILAENQSSSLNLRKKSVRQGNRLNLVLEFPTLPYPLPNLHLPYPLLFCPSSNSNNVCEETRDTCQRNETKM